MICRNTPTRHTNATDRRANRLRGVCVLQCLCYLLPPLAGNTERANVRCCFLLCYNLFASLDTSLNNVSDRIAGARGTEINTRDKPQSTVHMIGVYCAKIAY